jgi:hypothetical protein
MAGRDLLLRFALNAFSYPSFAENDVGWIRFSACSRYRLGGTNDEGWHRGQCRYSKISPGWGELYELLGLDDAIDFPADWVKLCNEDAARHFLFYSGTSHLNASRTVGCLSPFPATLCFALLATSHRNDHWVSPFPTH